MAKKKSDNIKKKNSSPHTFYDENSILKSQWKYCVICGPGIKMTKRKDDYWYCGKCQKQYSEKTAK